MNKLKKLGKGLEDISYLFLSSEEENTLSQKNASEEQKKEQPSIVLSTKSICLIGNYCDYRDAFILVNLSLALAHLGMRIAVVDIDKDLTCLNFFLDKKPHEMQGNNSDAVIQEGPLGVKLIGLNPESIKELSLTGRKEEVSFELEKIENNVDLILFSVMRKDLEYAMPIITDKMRECLVLVSPDKHEMLMAYKIIKSILLKNPLAKIGTIITEIDHMYEIEAVFEKMSNAVKNFLDKELYKYGFLFKLKQEAGSNANIASFYDSDLRACISNIAQIIILRLNLERSELDQSPEFKRMLTDFMKLR